MSSEIYTLENNNYTEGGKNILLLKSIIFDAEEMMVETTGERELGRLRHAIRVLRYELRHQRKVLEEGCTKKDFLAQ